MKRSKGIGALLYRLLAMGIFLGSVVLVIGMLYTVQRVYGDLTRTFPIEPQVPSINVSSYKKVTEILQSKDRAERIVLTTREVKFGKPEPFNQ